MFNDMHLVLAWFGFVFLMLLFRVPFFLAGSKFPPWHRIHSAQFFPFELLRRHVWHRS